MHQRILYSSLLLGFLGAPALAQGDDCSNASPLNTLGSVAFDTSFATTSGFQGGGSCGYGAGSINQDLFWQFTAPSAGDYVIDTIGSTFDTKLSIHAGTGCAAVCVAYNDDASGLASRNVVYGVNVGDPLLIQVGGFGGAFGPGTLNIALSTVNCGTPGNCCTMPIPLAGLTSVPFDNTSATTSQFNGGGPCGGGSATIGADLFYVWTAQAAGDYDFDTFGSNFDTKLAIHVGNSCLADCIDYNDDTNGLQSRVSAYNLNAGDTILIQLGGFGAATGSGSLNITNSTSPCAGAADDMFEENDECNQAAGIGNGTYPNLFASRLDWDYFLITVDAGSTLAIDALFVDDDGDIDIFLYAANNCMTFAGGHVGCFNSLACSESGTDNESILYTNGTASTQDYILKVFIWPPTSSPDCNNYDLVIAGASPGSGSLGSQYCGPANLNSTGNPGNIIATGSAQVATNNFTLRASDLPNGQFAFFIASENQGFIATPGGSMGNLCLSSPIARFNMQVGQTSGGIYSQSLNLNAFPQNPSAPVTPGETWNFQCWHRDLVGGSPTSNFTNAVSVLFQ